MEDDNLLDEELTGPSRDFDSPATFSKKIVLKFGIRHASTEVDAVNHNNNITDWSHTRQMSLYLEVNV